MIDDRMKARIAGFAYLVTIAAGIFAEAIVRGSIPTRGDPPAALRAVAEGQTLYRLGAIADIAMLSAYIVVTVLLFELLRRSGRSLALSAAAFSLVGIAVLAANLLLHLTPLALLDAGLPGRADLALLALRLHGAGYNVSLAFFAVYCVLIAILLYRSRAVPLAVSVLMGAGGLVRMALVLVWFVGPETSALVPGFLRLVPLLGEASLALWLTLFAISTRPSGPSG
ncbi:hypothetical protein B2G71_14690 [Novosphingobium sp. PC22D]|uniref:DUF4386 domain-containing protein n=1 Tax=Novosphingobium sp. PC22D TaxID=1962403 RepID=UPI000BEFDD6D|nr:DUF4386 domain-containing protein [Novosphingobium sp. PC22D]PEQ12021.1 hypothetical protein B2G71_14690 [Novosphingobium sp. PC22D]